jgi:hypothetical protein
MTLTLYVDGPRWRAHQDEVCAELPGLVPVVKGNGYGFGAGLLGEQAQLRQAAAAAVGLARELDSVRATFTGDLLVLQPHLPGTDPLPEPDERVLRTVATAEGLEALEGHRVVVELRSSMHRFGLDEPALARCAGAVRAARLEGFALHLPLAEPPGGRVAEVLAAAETVRRAGPTLRQLWLSHVSGAELAELARRLPDVELRTRVGTRLWLGSDATAARSTVLAVHTLRRGERFGYWQHRAPRAGHLVVVAGGTANGIALSAPPAGASARARGLAIGGLEAMGRSLSPFRVGGARRWFAEPPHMQVSMLWLPSVEPVPAVGSELDVNVRMTTVTFDRVVVD